MYKDRRDQSEGVKAERRFSGLTEGSQRGMPSLLQRAHQGFLENRRFQTRSWTTRRPSGSKITVPRPWSAVKALA